MADRLARLLLVGSHSDVTFVVGGEQFHVHRLIMALQSEYFSRLLYGHMKEALPGAVVVMENTSPDAFRHLLHYAYSGNISIPAGKVEVRCVCVCVGGTITWWRVGGEGDGVYSLKPFINHKRDYALEGPIIIGIQSMG